MNCMEEKSELSIHIKAEAENFQEMITMSVEGKTSF